MLALPWLFVGPSYTLSTRLQPHTCALRIRQSLGPRRFLGLLPPGQEWAIRGTVWDRRFQVAKNIKGRDSWQPIAWGHIHNEDGGSRITMRFSVHPFVLVFEILWFGALVVPSLMNWTAGRDPNLLITVLFVLFLAILHVWCRLTNRDQEGFVLGYVRDLLDAT